MSSDFRHALDACPLIAILRGLAPEAAPAVGEILVGAGFRIIEVPLNSPRPFDSIAVLAKSAAERVIIGAGTVLRVEDVGRVQGAGGRLIVMPHADPAIIAEAKRRRMICAPGVATPTEGFGALAAGADALKMFPAETMPPAVVKAWRAVFPPDNLLIPVGGITPDKLSAYREAGASGFGLGTALFRPDMPRDELRARSSTFAGALRQLA